MSSRPGLPRGLGYDLHDFLFLSFLLSHFWAFVVGKEGDTVTMSWPGPSLDPATLLPSLPPLPDFTSDTVYWAGNLENRLVKGRSATARFMR